MAVVIKPRQRLCFAGDSITDAGRRDVHPPLGDGYVRIIDDLIAARHPAHRLSISNAGIGGDTIRMLARRWDADVVAQDPHWLSVLIGANDAWGWLIKREGFVAPGEYEEIYTDILARLPRRTRLVLMDSFILCDVRVAKEDHVRMAEALPKYRAVVARMVKRFRARHIKLHDVFKPHLRRRAPESLAPDAVHPTRTGHTIIAHAWLRAMGW